jgi:hypothetical protein
MRASELRVVIDDIRDLVESAGNPQLAQCFGELAEELAVDGEAEDAIRRLRAAVDALSIPAPARYIARLKAAGLDESAFGSIFQAIVSDRTLQSKDLVTIVQEYSGRRPRGTSKVLLHEGLKRAFNTKLYDRDAQELANRATPV